MVGEFFQLEGGNAGWEERWLYFCVSEGERQRERGIIAGCMFKHYLNIKGTAQQ